MNLLLFELIVLVAVIQLLLTDSVFINNKWLSNQINKGSYSKLFDLKGGGKPYMNTDQLNSILKLYHACI